MPDITINGTIISLPESSQSPNWSPSILQAFTLIANALQGVAGTFDISPQVFNISAFNSATNQDITGLTFSNTAVQSAVITYYVYRSTDTVNASESGQLFINYNASRVATKKWAVSQEITGNANIAFSITDAGQVQFTTTSLAGSNHIGFIGFSAKTLVAGSIVPPIITPLQTPSNFRRVFSGLQLVGQSITLPSIAGEVIYNNSLNRLQTFDTALRSITTDDGIQTLTNKTISSASNTFVLTGSIVNADINTSAAIAYSKLNLASSIVNADVNASAAIARSKLASGSVNHVVINDGSGVLSSEAQLAITRGGTGQSTANAGFAALSPLSTKGDLVGFSTLNARIPIGTNGQVLQADSTQALGLKWATASVAPNSISEVELTTSVAGNGLAGGNGTPLSVNVDNSTIEINADTLRVKDAGITSAKVQSNINLPGNTVQENGLNVIVSNTNASTSLCIVRGSFSGIGGIIRGEGFTVSLVAGGTYDIVFTTPFAAIPVIVATINDGNTIATDVINISTLNLSISTARIGVATSAGGSSNRGINFIAIGTR